MIMESLPESMADEIEAVWSKLAEEGLHCVSVTSALHDEGASALASALARRSVQGGQGTLLVELSPERPVLAARLGLTLEPGVPVRVGADGFGVASVPADAGGHWREPGFLGWKLAEWQRDWDMVVLDTPPLLAANPSEGPSGLTVAAKAPTTILVILAGRTKSAQVKEAMDKLQRAGGRICGVVLNDRENPSLREEMERELGRIARLAPRLVERLRGWLRRSTVLGMRV